MNYLESSSDEVAGPLPLQDRVAVVTGASSGIGAATARRLAADGANVALIARRADRVQAVANEIGDRALALVADVADEDAVATAGREVADRFGRVDLVVANAGVMLPAPFETTPLEQWDRMLGANLRGLLLTAGQFSGDLLASAADGAATDLVLTSSIGAHIVFPTYAVYAATKAGTTQLARTLRAEFGPRGVRVAAVEPGLTQSELADHVQGTQRRAELDGMFKQMESLTAEDIADVIAFKASRPAHVNLGEVVVVPTAQG